MSPAQRVGQLFVVPFDGDGVEDGSAIARLLDEYRVGGVVLDARRGNFTNDADAPAQAARLTNALQERAHAGSGPYVPLLVAVSQLGDAFPDTALTGGMTVPPSQLALGATWQPEHAARIGQIVGRELAAVGVHLLLGPNLDVAAVPRPGTSGDLGTRVFGGSPSWVARFGRAYVRGVHGGGGGRVATAAASFPGLGVADRSPAEEGAVVEIGLAQLREVDLAPFVAVMGHDGDDATDVVVSSYVRYRAVQQQTDRPFSLDSGGMRYLFAQVPELYEWRERGGVVMSAGLGLPAVRRYLDPNLAVFNVRRVTGEALAAGNDLLLLTDFGPPEAPADGQANIEAAVAWLADRYIEDETVREAVDEASRRVLAMKLRLLGPFALRAVLVDAESAPAATGLGADVSAEVAEAALTILAPGGATASSSMAAPQPGDAVLFVVDERPVRDCPDCPARLSLDGRDLVARVLRRYGPAGSGRVVREEDVRSVAFIELKAWLQTRGHVVAEDTPTLVPELEVPRAFEVDELVRAADWMVFAMRDVRPADAPGSDAMKLYLKSPVAEAGQRRHVALAFGGPHYLDTTEIAKLHAYYALYSRNDAFVDLAARALFGDAPARGSSPVSVPGVAYDLVRRLEPALDQTVSLELVGHNPERPLREGSEFAVRTTVVIDGNGNPAPDGTRVTFRRFDSGDGVFLPDVPSHTRDGRVTQSMRAERSGELTVNAVFDNGLRSDPLVVRIEGGGAAALLADVTSAGGFLEPRVRVDWGILLLSLTLILLATVIGHGLETDARVAGSLRVTLLCLAWGLAGYLLVAAGGVPLGRGPGGLPLWPAGWPEAYLAPVLSFALALVPVLPGAARAITARVRRNGTR